MASRLVPPADTAAVARLYSAFAGGIYSDAADRHLASVIDQGCPGIREAVLAAMASHCPPRVTSSRASVRDPEGLLAACGIIRDGPKVMVQAQLAAHGWARALGEEVTAAYARLLPPGSLLFLSWLAADWPGCGAELLTLLGNAAGAPMYGHSPAAVAGWLEAAGMEVVPPGPADARAWPDRAWAEPRLAAAAAATGQARAVEVMGRVPSPGVGGCRVHVSRLDLAPPGRFCALLGGVRGVRCGRAGR